MRKITTVVEDDGSGFVEIKVRRRKETGEVEVLSPCGLCGFRWGEAPLDAKRA